MPRLFAVALIAPFLGTGVLEGQIWLTLVLGLYLPIHPTILAQISPNQVLGFSITPDLLLFYLCVFVKEICLGLGLGILAALPFYAMECAGIFIDNQRGASQSEGTEILTGKSVSPMGGVLFQCLVFLFYASGAFLLFLSVIYTSYVIWPVPSLFPMPNSMALPLFFAGKVAWMMTFTLLLSAPITVACLLVDISLGLINRFSPQLNAYILAMPIKSGLAAVLLLFYLSLMIHNSGSIYQYIYEFIEHLPFLLQSG